MLLAAGVLAVAVVVAVLLALGPDGAPTGPAVAQDVPGPVLLVPGYGGGTGTLDPLAQSLRAAGRTAVVVEPADDGSGDLREVAGRLDLQARALLDAGAPSVDVVGFSAGGVTARLWADELGGDEVARRVVTLGSPHHGTDVAALAAAFAAASCPAACRQLVPGSDLLEGLDETPDGPRWVSIWTAQDRTVTPPESARLDDAVNIELQQVCADATVAHAQLPTDPLTVALVRRALGVAPLEAAPAASECAALRGG